MRFSRNDIWMNVTIFLIEVFIYDLSNIPSTIKVIKAGRPFIHNASLELLCSHIQKLNMYIFLSRSQINPLRLIAPFTNTIIAMSTDFLQLNYLNCSINCFEW